MARDTEISIYQGNLPAQVSRRVEARFTQEIERMVAMGETGMVGMSAMSEVARHAAFKVATTGAAAELLAKGAEATRPNPNVTQAEQVTQQKLFEEYTNRMAQLAEITNIKILQAVDRATEQLSKRGVMDALEDFDAQITDAILGRPRRPALPRGTK